MDFVSLFATNPTISLKLIYAKVVASSINIAYEYFFKV